MAYKYLIALSGGKDSSYLTYNFRRESILTATVDTGLLSEPAKINIEHLTKLLGVDHICLGFNGFKHLYQYYLNAKLPNLICMACGNTIRSLLIKYAAMNKIPAILFGFSPSQFWWLPNKFSTNCEKSLRFFTELPEEFDRIWDPSQYKFHPDVILPFHEEGVYPKDFQHYDSTLGKSAVDMGLIKESNIDETNCLLSPLIKYLTMKYFGYNPFIGTYLIYRIRNRLECKKTCYRYVFDDLLVRSGIYRHFIKRKKINYVLSYLEVTLDGYKSGLDKA